MNTSRLVTLLLLSIAVFAPAASAEPPSFQATALPEGWTIVKGRTEAGLRPEGVKPLEIRTAATLALPVEATLHFRAAAGDTIAVQVVEEDAGAAPLLEFGFTMQAGNQAAITAKSSGALMATVGKSARRWDFRDKNTGAIDYRWRFPRARSVWDERDYREIGAADARLTPFEAKAFTLRLMLTSQTRQIWLDDRLVAEDRAASLKPVSLVVRLAKTARLLAAEFSTPESRDPYLPLVLDHYSHLKAAQESSPQCALVELNSIPLRVPATGNLDINLGESLYRYRTTHGSGPDAGYPDAMSSWPDAFRIDPSQFTFRVPYRNYQNVWLLALVDERPNTVPGGTLRFFHECAGYPASTDWEISDEAIRKGLVTKLPRQTAEGKQLYLVKVPVDTDGLYGMRDRADQFLQLEVSKPVALGRTYPDPIFYGYFPAGLPSSVHVVGITLEEAPLGFQVEPKQYGYVFESPEKPSVTVSVSNTTAKTLGAEVRAETTSYDGSEKRAVEGRAAIAPGSSGNVELEFDLKKLGWHDLKVAVEAGGARRTATLSLVVLPPNTRTYGSATNENRFGLWSLAGHYTALKDILDKTGVHADPGNERIMATYRKLGLLELGAVHSLGRNFAKWNRGEASDLEARQKAIDAEVANIRRIAQHHAEPLYFYGGEWGAGSSAAEYGPWPLYTGQGDRPLDEKVRNVAETQVSIFTAIGRAIRQSCPQAKLCLQWGTPATSLVHLRAGMPKDLVDGFGMDAPMFELLPEISNALGSVNAIWMLRAEARRLGWPRLPIRWCEGPFFPTTPGALTERDQMDYQVRYLLLGLAYGVDQFVSGIVPQDAGNYYGAEHYGPGIFHRTPLDTPKPAVAAVATMTSMLCGADPVGAIDTGCLTTYCQEFQRAKDKAKIYALWRVRGSVHARIKVRGPRAVLTDAMGNATEAAIQDGAIRATLSTTPVWLTGVEQVEGFQFGPPAYESAPAKVTRPLAEMTAEQWAYDGSEDPEYANHHFAVCRVADPSLKAEFGQGEKEHARAVAITLPLEAGDRPLANRYGALRPKKPLALPGKPSALGIWIKGNSSWGRIVYQLRDAKGEMWTAAGTKNDWNCDDLHAWSYVNFEGWRYVRFPLPGNQPYDAARDLETTWWGSRGGDGIVDLPLVLEKIIVEARNEVPVLGEMKIVADRSYKLAGLVAEYDSEVDATPVAIARNKIRMPPVAWAGPTENPIARLIAEGIGAAPEINAVVEPEHFNDGRRMVVRFDAHDGLAYNLYLSRTKDGRGADLLRSGVKDGDTVTGFRPELPVFLFLTAVDKQKLESKPSTAFLLTTHDKFLEK